MIKHPLCYIALILALICYVQRCIENKFWITFPIFFITLFAVILGSSFLTLLFFTKIGWIK